MQIFNWIIRKDTCLSASLRQADENCIYNDKQLAKKLFHKNWCTVYECPMPKIYFCRHKTKKHKLKI
jgi:hypothetical protein